MDYIILDWLIVLWGVLAILFSIALGTGVLFAIAATLPATFLHAPDPRLDRADKNPVLNWARRIGRNVIGFVVIAIGLILALPGVPGPGLPIVLLGLTLVDFPGKHRLVQKLLSAPRVLGGINALRVRLGKPPLASP